MYLTRKFSKRGGSRNKRKLSKRNKKGGDPITFGLILAAATAAASFHTHVGSRRAQLDKERANTDQIRRENLAEIRQRKRVDKIRKESYANLLNDLKEKEWDGLANLSDYLVRSENTKTPYLTLINGNLEDAQEETRDGQPFGTSAKEYKSLDKLTEEQVNDVKISKDYIDKIKGEVRKLEESSVPRGGGRKSRRRRRRSRKVKTNCKRNCRKSKRVRRK